MDTPPSPIPRPAPPTPRSFRPDIALSLLASLTFTLWLIPGTHRFSPLYFLLTSAFTLTSSLAGRLLARTLRIPLDFPARFLVGFLTLNAFVYLLIRLLPFGPLVDFLLLAATTLALSHALRHRPVPAPRDRVVPSALCLLLSLVGATLWSRDSLTPLIRHDDTVVLKCWGDNPFHVAQISMFAHSHGPRTIQAPKMAGGPVYLAYHYASYAIPALLTAGAGASAFWTYSAFWVPAGIFLTGLAAYSLARFWFGAWPAVAATALLLLTPDPAYLGAGNFFLSYYWLMEVTAASGYGIAVVAAAWLLMFHACDARRGSLVLLSFLTLAVGLIFKSHMVLPSAPLLWLYPAVFMPRVARSRRIAWIGLATLSFVLVIYVSQRSTAVPVIRVDFSAANDYLTSVVRQFEHDGPVKRFFDRYTPTSPLPHDLAWGLPMLFLCTFGAVGVAYPFLAVGLFRTMPRRVLLFPAAVASVYLFMSVALAYDTHEVGRPEELLHRPFPWAYFVLYAWVGGAAYRSLYGDAPPPRAAARLAFTGLLLLMAACSFAAARDVQVGPSNTWGLVVAGEPHPAGLIDCALYVREHLPSPRRPRPLIQDSANDPHLIVTAFSEAQTYVSSHHVDIRPTPGVPERLAEVSTIPALRDGRAIRSYFAAHHITWYLLHPETHTDWPPGILGNPAFQSHGYRLYQFTPAK